MRDRCQAIPGPVTRMITLIIVHARYHLDSPLTQTHHSSPTSTPSIEIPLRRSQSTPSILETQHYFSHILSEHSTPLTRLLELVEVLLQDLLLPFNSQSRTIRLERMKQDCGGLLLLPHQQILGI